MSNQTEELPLTEAQIERRELVAEKHAQAKALFEKAGHRLLARLQP